MKVTLLGFWLIPLGISMYDPVPRHRLMHYASTQRYWRMLTLWTAFTTVSAYLLYKAKRRPLDRTTPKSALLI